MVEFVKPFAEWCSAFVEFFGVLLIILFALYALFLFSIEIFKGKSRQSKKFYKESRQQLGRGILLGLEFLVAADIIHTVAVELNFRTVGVLFLIVLIRTFLSFTLEVELTGRWPWQNHEA